MTATEAPGLYSCGDPTPALPSPAARPGSPAAPPDPQPIPPPLQAPPRCRIDQDQPHPLQRLLAPPGR
jgi:hypothetical protein